MKQEFMIHNGCQHLLLFFAGWGMDATPFRENIPGTSDLMICYDYRTLDFDTSPLNRYDRIDVIAWSMGVWAASQILSSHSLPIVKSIAINGTPFPIDETRGIPPAIFQGTLDGLSEASHLKFLRRMCADAVAFKRFQEITPQRPVKELKEELAAIGRQYRNLPPSGFIWQQAYIGENDRIFPPANQQAAWKETSTKITTNNEAHYFENLIHSYAKDHE